ncbi:MAG: nuclear transport factor 2 family protein [Bacteroidetes bacterium]|nr:MAG: nuclear transport factor 2 family protein [Bacteroidota bacterium]
MSYLQNIRDMYRMIDEGKVFEALEQYYADEVVVVDGMELPRQGKAAQRQALQEWFGGIAEMHGGGTTGITANEETATTMVESWTEITMKNGDRIKMEEVGVQKWQGDKIVHERFYYSIPS